MIQSMLNKYVLISICLFITACSGIKLLPKGEKLYTGAEIKLVSTDKSSIAVNKGFIKNIAEGSIRPIPNASYLGMRPQVWMYMKAGTNPTGKFKKWLKKTGQAPVLMSSIKPQATAAIIDAKLFNIGIFNSMTEFRIVEKEHTASVVYTSYIHTRFKVKEVQYSISDDSISHIIHSASDMTVIKSGDDYNLDMLKVERIRIDALLKDRGYFYFNPDYLIFKADTSDVNRTITLKLTLKDSIPENAKIVYRIRNVFINQNYSLTEEPKDSTIDTLIVRRTVFLGKKEEQSINPRVIIRSVYLRKHQLYSRENHT